MPPIATTPIAMNRPVRIRFFSFDLGGRLISILLYDGTREVLERRFALDEALTLTARTVFHGRLFNRRANRGERRKGPAEFTRNA